MNLIILSLILYGVVLSVWAISIFTKHLHGKYSHSWVIGSAIAIAGVATLFGGGLFFGVSNILYGELMVFIDLAKHKKEHRGLFEHEQNCHMIKVDKK